MRKEVHWNCWSGTSLPVESYAWHNDNRWYAYVEHCICIVFD